MLFKKLFFFLAFLFPLLASSSEPGKREMIALPQGHYFNPLWLDPMQAMCSTGLFFSKEDGKIKRGLYFPFVVGVQKELIRMEKDKDHGYEFGFELSSYTQFEIITPNGVYQRNLMNTDYRLGSSLNIKNMQWAYRFRFFHESSHLGDDYMIRNKIRFYMPNPINYEQVDVTASYNGTHMRYYAGAGMVVRIETIRKRFSAEAGFTYSFAANEKASLKYVGGIDMKFMQQTRFDPNIKVCAGLEFGKPFESPKLVVEYFTGHPPFSLYEYRRIQWLGLGFYFNVL